MKRVALGLVVLTGACAATPTPTRTELAQALGAVTPTDLTHIACRPVAGYPSDFVCRWRQREGRRWRGRQAYLSSSARGWQLTTEPQRRP